MLSRSTTHDCRNMNSVSRVTRAHSFAAGSIWRTREVGSGTCHRWFGGCRFCYNAFLGWRGTSGKQPPDYQRKHPTPGSTFIHEAESTEHGTWCNQRNSSGDTERRRHEKILRGKRSSLL